MAIDWWLPGNNGFHWKLHNHELLWLFFPIYMERPGLLLCTQSWFSVVPAYCKCLIQESKDLALKEKLRTEYFCNRPRLLQTCLPKAPSPTGLQGRQSRWQPALWPYTFCHKRAIFPDLKNLMAHECWGDFIKLINMTTIYLKPVALLTVNVVEFMPFSLKLSLAQAIQGREFEGYFVSDAGSLKNSGPFNIALTDTLRANIIDVFIGA